QSMQSGAADTGTAAPASSKKTHVARRYPKAEARLNSEEAQVTKELNMQESQQVAANAGGTNSASARGTSSMGGGMTGSASAGAAQGGNASSQPQ
ncbi:MAG TPA: hypothetical protein VFA87_02500, partial [Rhizomicrobium sp.]|nr:hypothetical protein [Rhizomicrobium sp.]